MREIPFVKMEGCGNDYIYINAFSGTSSDGNDIVPDLGALARIMSDRHFGIGSDGLVLILPPEHPDTADVRMRMFNADGSEAEMCGNASRCVVRFAWERGLVKKPVIRLETKAGIKLLHILRTESDDSFRVCVNMGSPELVRRRIPVFPSDDGADKLDAPCIDHPIQAAGREWHMTCVNMGNPHAVIFVDDVESLNLPVLGPQFEHHPWFPSRTNTEFVQLLDHERARMRVWERGAGETLACGTGACAAAVACALTGRTGRHVHMELRGGNLDIEWNQHSGHILMTGPARITFSGVFLLDEQEHE